MGQPAAKQNDQITATDIHIVMVPSPSGPVPTPLPHVFQGILNQGLSTDVMINNLPAATINSVATNIPPHLPTPPGTIFQIPPTNRGQITLGSTTVLINGKGAARNGDMAQTCADPVPNMAAIVVSTTTNVLIGG